MMRKLIAIAWTDMRLQFTEKSDIMFFLILPIIFTTILAISTSGGDPNADNRYPVLVVDLDRSALSAEVISALNTSTVVRPTVASQSDADQAFTKKDAGIPVLLTIPAGFSQSLLAGQPATLDSRRAPSDSRVLATEQAIRSAATQVSSAVAAANASAAEAETIKPFASAAARQAYVEQGITLAQDQLKTPKARVEVKQGTQVVQQSATGAQQSSAGELVTWVMITLLGAGAVFVDERLGGTLNRMITTPTRPSTILGGKLSGRLASGLLQMTLLIVFGAVVFKLQWGQSPLALVAVMLAFGLAGVSLGVLLGTFAKTRSQAGWMMVLFAMLMAALGGCWWPLEITPPLYQTVVKILPTTWAMSGFEAVLVRGANLPAVLPQVSVLLLFALVYFVLGVRRFRWE
jgi:ABC-2 type transport system permease protein